MSTDLPLSEFGLLMRLRDPISHRADPRPWKLADLFFWFASGMTAASFSGKGDVSNIGALVEASWQARYGSLKTNLIAWRKRGGVVEWKRLAFLRWLDLTPFSLFSPDSMLFPVSEDLEAGVELHSLLKQGFLVDESTLPSDSVVVSPAGLLSTMVPAVRSGVSFTVASFQSALARLLWNESGLTQFDAKVAAGDLIAALLGYLRLNLRRNPPSAVGDFTTSVMKPLNREIALSGLISVISAIGGAHDPQNPQISWIEEVLGRPPSRQSGSQANGVVSQLLGRILRVDRSEVLQRSGWIERSVSGIVEAVQELVGSGEGDVGIVAEFSEQMNLIDLYILDKALKGNLREVMVVFTPLALLTSFPHLYQAASYRALGDRDQGLRLGVGPLGISCILSSGTDRWIHEKALRWALDSLKGRGYSNVVYWPNGSTLQVTVGRLVAEEKGATILPPASYLTKLRGGS